MKERGSGNLSTQRVMQIERETRCLLAVDVPGRESDVFDGHISVERLRTGFTLEAVSDKCEVDRHRWWPTGPLVEVHFEHLMQFLCSAPCTTLTNLHCVAAAHGLVVPYCCMKSDVWELMLSHECGGYSQCMLRFRALSRDHEFGRRVNVYEVRVGDDRFLGEEAGKLIVSTGMLSLYQFVGIAPARHRIVSGSSIVVRLTVSVDSIQP
jgi:hypothetical protein